jgi:hypothetical protein
MDRRITKTNILTYLSLRKLLKGMLIFLPLIMCEVTLEKIIAKLRVFGDFVVTIKWMNNEIQAHDTSFS